MVKGSSAKSDWHSPMVGMGAITEIETSTPGMNSIRPKTAATLGSDLNRSESMPGKRRDDVR